MPQFEVGPERVGKGGVVRDDRLRTAAADAVAAAARDHGHAERGRADSRLAGPKGNREIFLWLSPTETSPETVAEAVDRAGRGVDE